MVVKDIRENINMDAATGTTFTARRGFFLSATTLLLIGAFFLCTLIAVGFIVYNFVKCPALTQPVKKICEHQCLYQEGRGIKNENYRNPLENIERIRPLHRNNTEEIKDVRLPRSIIPIAYNISLIPFLNNKNFTFNGEVLIFVKVLRACNNITLHSAELNIFKDFTSVLDERNVDVMITKQYFIESKQFFIIDVGIELQEGREYKIFIKYSGKLLDFLQGFYRSSYQIGDDKIWLASTQFQPTDARRAFPCFDEPSLKAKFIINIGRPIEMTSLSNMPQKSGPKNNVPSVRGYVWDNYEESFPMSTYLVAFVVCDFTTKNVSTGNGTFSVWARKNAIDTADYALSIGPKILKNLENYFQSDFPLPKIDMIALPDFYAGAMENWGLIAFRETAMLYQEGVSSTINRQRIASIVGHELAHQWFGNLVTPSWWSDLWLNEGFASYMEYLAVDDVEPTWKTMDQFVVHELQDVAILDAMTSSHQISIEVNDPDEINDLFDRISYSKGGTIIRMMSHFLTSNVFREGLKNYLKEKSYKSAEQDDLWKYLTDAAISKKVLDPKYTVKEIMDTWTLQVGFPVLTVKSDKFTKLIRLQQERFVYVQSERKKYADLLWWVPITYTTSNDLNFNNTRPSFWIKREKVREFYDENLITANWVIVNIQVMGYFRVNYDEDNWKALTAHLLKRKNYREIAITNRAQLLDDALNLARGGYLNYEIALNITRYLKYEDEYVPWKSAVTAFNFIDSMLIKEGDYYLIKEYLLKLLEYVYKKVGFDDSKDHGDMLNLYKRYEILSLACHLGHNDCLRQSKVLYQNWMMDANPDMNNPISPNLRGIVYCTAIQTGSETEWDFLYERFNNSKLPSSEMDIMLSAMGCSAEPWILIRYLQLALSNTIIRKQDIYRVFASVSSNVIGQQIGFDFLRKNWNTVKTYLGNYMSTLNGIVKLTTSKMNTEFKLRELEDFINTNYKEINRPMRQALERIKINIDWMDRNYKTIIDWLRKYSAI